MKSDNVTLVLMVDCGSTSKSIVDYAQKLKIHTTYSTNGHKIYEINYSKNEKGEMFITSEGEVDKFPSP